MLKEVFNLVRVIIKGNKLVRAKSEVDGPILTWAHYLLVIWVLDFLLWVNSYTETQWDRLSL